MLAEFCEAGNNEAWRIFQLEFFCFLDFSFLFLIMGNTMENVISISFSFHIFGVLLGFYDWEPKMRIDNNNKWKELKLNVFLSVIQILFIISSTTKLKFTFFQIINSQRIWSKCEITLITIGCNFIYWTNEFNFLNESIVYTIGEH